MRPWERVFNALVVLFGASMLALLLAAVIYRTSEENRLSREAQAQAREFNKAVADMEAMAKRMKTTQAQVRP